MDRQPIILTGPMTFLDGIRAVTFDVGGTLIEPWPSVGHIYASVAEEHGWKGSSIEALNARFATAWHASTKFDYSRSAWSEIVDATFKDLVDIPPSQTFFSKLYARFDDTRSWRIYEDVIPALEALLARGLKLGVISNWDERLRPLLDALGLGNYLQAIVISHEVGHLKPSPVIFQAASQQLGLPPERILHVGDSPVHDVAGARAAGMRALRLQRSAHQPAEGELASLDCFRAAGPGQPL